MKTFLFSGLMVFCILFSACNNDEKAKGSPDSQSVTNSSSGKNDWEGKLIIEFAGDVNQYDFNAKEETTVFKEAGQISLAPNGDVVTLSSKFPKRNSLLQISDPEFNNVNPLLDLSDGWFGGYIYGSKISPDGQRIAVTITSYSGYKIEKDGVYVFDRSGNLLTKFEKKYQADWTPDGRLVMAGSYISQSSEESVKSGDEPGVFISDKELSSLTRIDPNFNNPPPASVSVSPDGKRVAFIKNSHVWVMNIDGTNVQQLTASGGDNIESFPAWSPDGKFIACWSYKTFEKSYYTAIAIIPSDAKEPIKLTNEAEVWPKNKDGYRVSGGSHQIVWTK